MEVLVERLLLIAITTTFVLAFNEYFNKPTWRHWAGLCVALLVLSFILVPVASKVVKYAQAVIDRLSPKIGVLNGYTRGDPLHEYKCIPAVAGVPPEVWLNTLKGKEALKTYIFKRVQ